MASDVIGLMDYLKIGRRDIAIRHPERLTKLFAFGPDCEPCSGRKL
jgi:hypothetical protein